MPVDFASLVVLSYQRPDALKRSLESLINNTNGSAVPYELIVHDDGSSGSNVVMLTQMARQKQLSHLLINAGRNAGVGAAMNRGFSIARGKWVAKLDADLEYLPGWLDAGVEILENFPNVGVVGFFDYQGYTPGDDRFITLESLDLNGKRVGWTVSDFVGSAFLMRRADWLKYGVIDGQWRGFEEGSAAFAEDVEWKRKMQELGFKLAITSPDTITNFGFGLGKSTVVVQTPQGVVETAKIHRYPALFGRHVPEAEA